MAMRAEFQNEMNGLHVELLKMGSVIEKSITLMIGTLKSRDKKVLDEIITRDDIIDDYETEIEKKCLSIIVRQQPVAVDLRSVTSVLKIITDLERIADQCSDIAGYLLKLSNQDIHTTDFDMGEIIAMAECMKKMVTGTIECYVNLDADTAVKIAHEDDIIDEYFSRNEALLQQQMKLNPEFIVEGVCYIHIIKYLERMADHTTNICEWIAYRVTGEHNQYN